MENEDKFDSEFSGSDRITSPFDRPPNPDNKSSVRLKISAAKLFSANSEMENPHEISIQNNIKILEETRSLSQASEESTFIIETRTPTVQTYV
jgi:hypothetical protein